MNIEEKLNMRKIWLIPVLAIVVMLGIGCSKNIDKNKGDIVPEINRESILLEAKKNKLIMDDAEKAQMADMSVQETDEQKIAIKDPKKFLPFLTAKGRSGALADVTAGSSYGLSNIKTDGNVFTVTASLGGLPETSDKYFYEAWVVKRGSDMEVLSIGKLEKNENDWISVYQTTKSLSEYDFFVITLEPDDEDQSPAEHILEGIIR